MHGDWMEYQISHLRREKALRDAEAFRLSVHSQHHRRTLGRVLRLTRILSFWL